MRLVEMILVIVGVASASVYTWVGWQIAKPLDSLWCACHLPSIRRHHLYRLWSFAWPNMVLWGVFLWLVVACTPTQVPDGELPVTGHQATPERVQWVRQALGEVRDCLRANDFPIVDQVAAVRIHATCLIYDIPGRKEPAYGYAGSGDVVHVGAGLDATKHEMAHALTRNPSEQPDGPAKTCARFGARPPPYQCAHLEAQ